MRTPLLYRLLAQKSNNRFAYCYALTGIIRPQSGGQGISLHKIEEILLDGGEASLPVMEHPDDAAHIGMADLIQQQTVGIAGIIGDSGADKSDSASGPAPGSRRSSAGQAL